MSEDSEPASAPDAYRIAAVSKLVGMPIPTIRMWERRYGAVTPARSTGNGRLYSRADITRLALLKAAVDAGHAIGTVATLSDEQIQSRLGVSPPATRDAAAEPCRVIVSGLALAERLRSAWAGRDDIGVVRELPPLAEIADNIEADSADALIVSVPTLQGAVTRQLRQLRSNLRATVMIVVYGFGTQPVLKRLDEEGILAVGMPADPAHLARICHLRVASIGPALSGIEDFLMRPIAPRRFDEAFLAGIAREPTSVRCECPNHLGDLLTKLNAFELYSQECERADPADVSIHVLLHTAAAHCREILEHALEQVLVHEGRPVPGKETGRREPA